MTTREPLEEEGLEPQAELAEEPSDTLDDEEEVYAEVVDALPVVSEVREIEPPRGPGGPVAATAAAAAVGGFVAGAATAAVLGRHFGRRLARAQRATPARPAAEVLDVVASRTYLVHVHVLGRRTG